MVHVVLVVDVLNNGEGVVGTGASVGTVTGVAVGALDVGGGATGADVGATGGGGVGGGVGPATY